MIAAFPYVEFPQKRANDEENRVICEIMIASVRRSMPGVRIVQMTDQKTPALHVDEVIRKKINHPFWVPWLMEFVAELPDEKVLFLDSDIVVQRDLSPLFNVGADIVLTTRGPKVVDGRQMPFLIGVVASQKPALWLELRDRVSAMPEPDKCWWGAQVGLFDMYMEEQNGRNQWKFAVVNCDPHNYVPKSPMDCPADKWVLHFKGPKRKPWMLSAFGERKQVAAAA